MSGDQPPSGGSYAPWIALATIALAGTIVAVWLIGFAALIVPVAMAFVFMVCEYWWH